MKQKTKPLWAEGEGKDFGNVAVFYAAGEDVVLDAKLVPYECLVNQAHEVMLTKQKLLAPAVAKKLLHGLEKIKNLAQQGKFTLKPELEDVHSNVEQYLIEEYGIDVGGWLRLGIARNDQVYTDTRMWMRDHLLSLADLTLDLVTAFVKKAAMHVQTVMPGYTHLRISQPITFGHWLTAKAYHLLDDIKNILNTYDTANSCPLGIFEMAGTHLAIDRRFTAKLLGFSSVTPNSLYTANQRGELEISLLSDLALLAVHIERMMNELILFSTHEFDLLAIGDAYTTGGTAQPNLKNPDTLEVVRANMAKIPAALMETIMIMDSLPSGFNRDTQQTKPTLFRTVELMENTLPVVTGIIATLMPNEERMEVVANMNFSTAPDLCNQLAVKGGVSFRQAYKVVKAIIKSGKLTHLSKLSPEFIVEFSRHILGKPITVTLEDVHMTLEAKASAFSHTSYGGSAPKEVLRMVTDIGKAVSRLRRAVKSKKTKVQQGLAYLASSVSEILWST